MNSSLRVGLTCLVYLLPVVLLVYQVWCNVDQYLQSPPVFLKISALREAPSLPPTSMCTNYPFNPARLLDLGLNISVAKNEQEVREAVLNLRGIDKSMTMRQLAELAGWRLASLVKEVQTDKEILRYSLSTNEPRRSSPSNFEESSGSTMPSPPLSSARSPLSPDTKTLPVTFNSPSGTVRFSSHLGFERSVLHFPDTTKTDRFSVSRSPGVCFRNTSGSRFLSSDSRLRHWQRSILPWGVCFTFTPPPEASLYKIIIRDYLGYECLSDFIFLMVGDCSEGKTICGMPCPWVRFISEFKSMFLVDMSSTTYSLRHGSILRTDISPYFDVKPLDLILLQESNAQDSFLDRLRSSCNPFPGGRQCIFYENMVPNTTIQDACKVTVVSEECPYTSMSVHGQPFALPRKSRQWKIIMSKCREGIQRSSEAVHALKEIRIYSLESLLADIAGSVGLYLGISFLACSYLFGKLICYLLDHIHTYSASTKSKKLVKQLLKGVSHTKTERLFKFIYICILCFLASVHAMMLLQEWVTYNKMPSITIVLKTQTSNASELPLENRILVVGHLSIQNLGCQIYPKYHHCFENCLLRKRVNLDTLKVISTRIFVQYLPLCRNSQRPRVQYVVPENFWSIADQPSLLRCSAQCQRKYLNEIENEKFVYKIKEYAPFDGIRLVCGFGGIVGIYLGYSCLHVLQYLLHHFKDWKTVIKLSAMLPLWLKSLTKISVPLLLLGVVILSFLNRTQHYLFERPISSYKKTSHLPASEFPTVTICRWPPFNAFRLAASAGFQYKEETFLTMNPYDRYDFVRKLIENLPRNSTLKPHQFLEYISWSLNETIWYFKSCSVEGKVEDFKEYWMATATILGRCYTFLPKDPSLCVDDQYLSSVFHPSPEHVLGVNDQVATTLHERGIQPPIGAIAKQINSMNQVEYKIINVALRMGTTQELYGTCVSRCLANQLSEKFDCRLPFNVWQNNLPDCGYPNLKAFLLALWNSTKYPLNSYENILGKETLTKCKSDCWNTNHKVYTIEHSMYKTSEVVEQISSTVPLGTTIHRGKKNIRIKTNFLEKEKDIEFFPIAQLLSEVGGIAGSLLGVSFFSLLTWIFSHFGSQRKNE